MKPKPRRGNRGQVHRDDVAKRQPPRPPRDGAAAPAPRPARSDGQRTAGGGGRAGAGGAKAGPRAPAKRGLGGDQVEGRRAVRELLIAQRRRTRDIWLAEGVEETDLVAEIMELAASQRVPVRRVARARLDDEARTDAPQGVLAHAEPLPEVDLERLLRRRGGRNPFLLALDGVTDPHNLGAVLRTAETAGVTGVILPRHRAAHVTPTVAKAAAGAIEYLPMAVVPGLPAALAELRHQGIWTVGLDADADQSLFGLSLATEPVCLVLGAEGSGLSRLARARCDVVVAIPQQGRIDSLNVSAAGAVALFEVSRHRGVAAPENQ